MPWRAAHGKAAEGGRLTVLETLPADELPPASPALTARPERDENGRFLPGNTVAKARKHRVGPRGALAELEAKADPNWQAANRWAKRYSAHRRGELARAHGGELSAGVSGMVESAAFALGDARYLRAKAAETGDEKLLKLAADLAKDARLTERDAWELAAREAQTRPRPDPIAALTARLKKGDS